MRHADIEKVMSSCHISEKEAVKLLNLADNDVDAAIAMYNCTKDEMYVGSGLAVNKPKRKHTLEMYRNGVVVDGHFMSMNSSRMRELRGMIERNEFDAGIVRGHENEMAEFELVDRGNADYQPKTMQRAQVDYSNAPSVGRRIVPRIISMDRSDGSVSVFVFFSGMQREVRVANECTVDGLLKFLFKYTKRPLSFICNGKKISGSESVTKYAGQDIRIEQDDAGNQ